MLSDDSREYNQSQTEVGHPLKARNGILIGRSSFGVGRVIGRRIYFHKDYADRILSPDEKKFMDSVASAVPFKFSCIRYSRNSYEFAFLEYPDFNTAREPMLSRIFIATPNNQLNVPKIQYQILHHKWLLVDNDYAGFDVQASWEWSKQWLSTLAVPADCLNRAAWNKQLEMFSLPTC